MTMDYTIERYGSTVTANVQEIAIIEAASLHWQSAADLPDGVEFAILRFGGVDFKVYRNVGAAAG